MTGPPTAAFSQLTVRYTGEGLPYPAVTTHGFTTPAGNIETVEAAIIDFGQTLALAISDTITVESVLWKVGPEATGPSYQFNVGAVGDLEGGVMPANTAVLVTLPTPGWSGRLWGRFYLPGLPEYAMTDDQVIVTTHLSLVLATVNAAYTVMEGVGSTPVVFTTLSSDPRAVESPQVAFRPATQRRRMRR